MSIPRFLTFSHLQQHRRRLAGAFVLAMIVGLSPAWGRTQFAGNPGTDLTTQDNLSRQQQQQQQGLDDNGNTDSINDSTSGATTPLRSQDSSTRKTGTGTSTRQSDQPEPRDSNGRRIPYVPGEFELFVNSQNNQGSQPLQDGRSSQMTRPDIRRFGANLLTDPTTTSTTQDPLPAVPGDYIVRPGDEVQLTLWGSADADLRLVVDRSGRISVPRVGSITVAGLKNSELADAITRRVGQTFKNFQLTATLGQVRAIRVFVGGYAQRPGSITLNGLGSVLHAIMRAGGPSAAGSFRDIHLNRGGREVAIFDLYDLLLKGDRASDQLVQPDDVIFIGPIGTQVAILGSVNQQAIFELKPGESLNDVLRFAGGFNAVADRSRVAIERLADRPTGRVAELRLPEHAGDALGTGDIVRVFSAVTASLPKDRQNKRIRVEGEVVHPGDYVMPPGSRVGDALRLAGGLTEQAYPYGTEFTRESVRKAQQINYERALRDLETDMAKSQSSQRATSAEELSAQSSSAIANARLLERLRQVRPTGRVVLQIAPEATGLPDLAIEDGDTISVPSRGTSVGVFGSVFNTGSFVFEPNHNTGDYVALAGGPTRGADKESMFVIHANGSVVSAHQDSSFWHSGTETFRATRIEPGDTIFVPEELNKSTFVQDAKDWTQILYQFGLGLAGLKSLGL